MSRTKYRYRRRSKRQERRREWSKLGLLFLCAGGRRSAMASEAAAGEERMALEGAGGSGPFEVVKDWISAFESKFPEADLSISSVGSGAAQSALWGDINCKKKPVEALCPDGEGDALGATVWGIGGGTIDSEEYTNRPELGLQQLPAMGGPVMVVYSKDVTSNLGKSDDKQLNMTLEIVAGIFNNSITTWDHPLLQQANPNLELPPNTVNTVVRRDKSGMSQTITEAIQSGNPSWPDEAVGKTPKWPLDNITLCSESATTCPDPNNPNQAPSTNCNADGQTGIGIALLRKPFSAGYLELGYYRQLQNFVGQAHISSTAHPTAFEPATPETIATTMDGLATALDLTDLSVDFFAQDTPLNGFPITRYVYWYLKKHPSQYKSCYHAWLTYKFIEWTYTDPLAAEIAVNGGWIVPPQSVVDRALQKLNEITCFDIALSDNPASPPINRTVRVSEYIPIPYREEEVVTQNSNDKIVTIVLPVVLTVIAILLGLFSYLYIKHKHKQADSVWSVKTSELTFDDPPETIGRGTFGLVILAEYRGTQVAVKRVIPTLRSSNTNTYSTTASGEISDTAAKPTGGADAAGGNALKRIWYRQSKTAKKTQQEGDSSDKLFIDDEYTFIQMVDRKGTNLSQDVVNRRSSKLSQEDVSKRKNSITNGIPDGIGPGALKPAGSVKRVGWAASIARRFSLDHDDGDDNDDDSDDDDDESTDKSPDVEAGGMQSGAATTGGDSTTNVHQSGRHSLSTSKGYASNGSRGVSSRESLTSAGLNSFGLYSASQQMGTKSQQQKRNSFVYMLKHPLQSSKRCFQPRYKDEYSRLKADFIVEMRHLSKLRHPCITTVMGAVIEKNQEPMLVMEYMDHGSLFDLLHNETMVLEGELLLPILRDIAQGIRFLHAASPQVIHGDLKAQNVLVDSKFRAKVADFGLSQKKKVGCTGTPFWMAPELLLNISENTSASDVYSFGMILYEVYSRKVPYEGEDYKEVIKLICDPAVNKRPPIPPACPPQAQNLMSDCLVRNPEHRPSIEEIDIRLKNLAVESVEPGEMHLSYQMKKELKAHRTDKLLSEVFPPHIAEALRDGRKVEPESREIVTIFFSDIVGFTDISSTLSPIKISDMLDRLYEKFDELSHLHDIFKVETIGDAYMAVTNLVKTQPDHAKRIAEFSIDALKCANETLIDLDDPERGCVNIRVGFHSGPVVANVVGRRNPRYCLFGDTVNTSSRMESNSKKNRIHCSERAAKLLRKQCPEMRLRSRGWIQVKGKGEMKTYWVNEGSTRHLNRRGSGLSTDSNASSVSNLSAVVPITAVPTGVEVKEQVTISMDGREVGNNNDGDNVQIPTVIHRSENDDGSNSASRGKINGRIEPALRTSFRSLHTEEHIPELKKVAEE